MKNTNTALLIGAVGAALTAVLVTQAEVVLSTLKIGYLQFPPVSLGLLLVAVGVNRLVKKARARWGLSSSDLLVIYCMTLVAAMVSSHGVAQKLVPLLVIPRYFADISNDWHGKFDPHLHSGLVAYDPHDPHRQAVVDDYYQKLPRDGSIPWHDWLLPLLNWGVLIALILFAFLCLTAILRRQWVDNERLAFPLAQLPLEIAGAEDGGGFWKSRALWLGIALPVFIYGVKGLHMVQPAAPDIPLTLSLSDYITAPPWDQGVKWFYLVVSFAAVGFFFLLPVDILFSLWFFFLLARGEQILFISRGLDIPQMPMYPLPLFVGYQTLGAYIALSGYLFWLGREHLAQVWRAAWGHAEADDGNEILPYRTAVRGGLASVVLSAAWLWHLGMSPWLALFEIGMLLGVVALVMARSTAEAGMLMTEITFRPIDLYRMVAPIHALGPTNLTLLAFFDNLFLRDQRGLLLTGMLDSARIADGTTLPRRAFVKVFAVGIAVALIVSVGLNIALPYHLGALNMDSFTERGSSRAGLSDYAAYFSPTPPTIAGAGWQMPTFFTIGFVLTILMTMLRAAFFWWPLHPLAYALSGSWGMTQFWFPCLVAWGCKALALRLGGMGLFQSLRPFFLGLVIGEFGMAVFFVLLNIAFHVPVPAFPWS